VACGQGKVAKVDLPSLPASFDFSNHSSVLNYAPVMVSWTQSHNTLALANVSLLELAAGHLHNGTKADDPGGTS